MHLVFCTRDCHENPRGRKAEEWGVPAYLSLQTLSTPGVIYFISLVRFPRIENPSMSVRRPGTVLGYSEPAQLGRFCRRGTKPLTCTVSRLSEPRCTTSEHRARAKRIRQHKRRRGQPWVEGVGKKRGTIPEVGCRVRINTTGPYRVGGECGSPG